jgi:hypothetical protein
MQFLVVYQINAPFRQKKTPIAPFGTMGVFAGRAILSHHNSLCAQLLICIAQLNKIKTFFRNVDFGHLWVP